MKTFASLLSVVLILLISQISWAGFEVKLPHIDPNSVVLKNHGSARILKFKNIDSDKSYSLTCDTKAYEGELIYLSLFEGQVGIRIYVKNIKKKCQKDLELLAKNLKELSLGQMTFYFVENNHFKSVVLSDLEIEDLHEEGKSLVVSLPIFR